MAALNESEDEEEEEKDVLEVGQKVKANFKAAEQYQRKENWFDGVIKVVKENDDGITVYDVTYEDGDGEEGVLRENIKVIIDKKAKKKKLEAKKRKIAKEKAFKELPFTFELIGTLEDLNDVITEYCNSGADVVTVLERMYASNNTKVVIGNKNKILNFYDVLVRRFGMVAEGRVNGGDGGAVERGRQCEGIRKILYKIGQDEPEGVGGIWSRRLGLIERKSSKLLRDYPLKVKANGTPTEGNEDFSPVLPWGDVFLLRLIWDVFSVTDAKHGIVNRAAHVVGGILSGAVVRSGDEMKKMVVLAETCLNYYGEERWTGEVVGFLVDVCDWFGGGRGAGRFKIVKPEKVATKLKLEGGGEKTVIKGCLDMIIVLCERISKSWHKEVEATSTLLSSIKTMVLKVKDKRVNALVKELEYTGSRPVIRLRAKKTTVEKGIVSLDPRINEDDKYRHGKDKGKEKQKAIRDKMERDFKRTKKAAKRELKLDAQHVERERRVETDKKTSEQKEKRHKNFAWLEGEQATINQQVREGGGLMSGGGTGAAGRAKARGKLGIKKGGKK
ncbi:hypothetical protein TL16_g03672 [Triparma laevis f. inornata]|nr:hypothetical protein TL16_g03672 [Triparma laevis f. inornata]